VPSLLLLGLCALWLGYLLGGRGSIALLRLLGYLLILLLGLSR